MQFFSYHLDEKTSDPKHPLYPYTSSILEVFQNCKRPHVTAISGENSFHKMLLTLETFWSGVQDVAFVDHHFGLKLCKHNLQDFIILI